MLWGIGKKPGGPVAELGSFEELDHLWRHADAVAWLDIEAPTAEDLRRLDTLIDLDDQALEDCLHGEPRARIEQFDAYLLVVAYGVVSPEERDDVEPRKLTVFRGERFLVTIHDQPSRSVNALRERCRRGAKYSLDQGFDWMLFRLIDGMVDRYLSLLDVLEDDVDEYEEQSFAEASNGEFLHTAVRMRRKLVEVRRLATAQRGLIDPLADGEYDPLSEDLSRQFRLVRSHLTHAIERAEAMLDRVAAAMQNYNALIAKRTNEIVQTLTVVTAVVLPLTLIAGVYGMNVQTWPGDDNPASFWILLAAMASIGGVMAILFRRWRWL